MNQSQLLAKKYNLPESRRYQEDRNFYGMNTQRVTKIMPLNRDIEALMTLAHEKAINFHSNEFWATAVVRNVEYFTEAYNDHPTKLDALCECLCQALLAE